LKPYYEDDRATIYHGDCRSILPNLVEGVLVTDPVWPNATADVSRPNYKGRLLAGTDIGYLFGEPPSVTPGRMLIAGMCRDASSDGKQTDHPCPRKLKHVKWLLRQWTDSWEIAVDPFAGSCTTALAAKEMGQKSICIEIEERYCEMGANRLTQAMLDLDVFHDPVLRDKLLAI